MKDRQIAIASLVLTALSIVLYIYFELKNNEN
jgi:hypothetical protein